MDQRDAELVELARRKPERLAERLGELPVREQAELVLRVNPRERLNLLLNAPKPMRLVRALPDGDLYLTVREIGPLDATPLLRLASANQLRHLLDLESWRKDRFDAKRSGSWVALLLEAGEPALRRFLKQAEDELLCLLLDKWVRVEQLEYEDSPEVHGHGVSEAGTEQGFVTPDGYHRFSPAIAEHAPAIRRLLQIFYQEQPDRYQRIVWSALWELPSEVEERALAWRQSRLEEHGFPAWEEALDVYAAPSGSRAHPSLPAAADPDGLRAGRSPLMPLEVRVDLAAAIDTLGGESRERVLHEAVSLANRLLVADGGDAGEPAAHRAVLQKAAGYVGIALTVRGADAPGPAGRLLEQIPLLELFREGYAMAVELQAAARRMVREGWPKGDERALSLLDSPIQERVEALLAPRPLYFEAGAEGKEGRPREFRGVEELEETRVSLEMADLVGSLLLDRMGLTPPVANEAEPPRLSMLFLTIMAWHHVRGELRGDPLPPEVVADVLRTVASRRTAGPEAPARALETLVRGVAQAYRLEPRKVALLEGFGRYALERLGAECATLDPGVPVYPRQVSCLLVAGR